MLKVSFCYLSIYCNLIVIYLSTHCWLLYRNAAVRWDPKSFLLSQLELQGIFVHDVNKPLEQSKKVVNIYFAQLLAVPSSSPQVSLFSK
jgi:hypothetical protein